MERRQKTNGSLVGGSRKKLDHRRSELKLVLKAVTCNPAWAMPSSPVSRTNRQI
jgi:hypothetical protein